MLKYAKIVNEETKLCDVGIGSNNEFYKSIGMEVMDVEQAYDGQWYIVGYAPKKPESMIIQERIDELKQKLADADYWGQKYLDGEYTEEEWQEKVKQRKLWREEIRELEKKLK